mmetsp:Transcript_27795/g.57628  ORF Transcript_27795/g.57628 Transcript_27795/m.57628 type:complete len:432 (+) Transcript_27795:27-1322(+)
MSSSTSLRPQCQQEFSSTPANNIPIVDMTSCPPAKRCRVDDLQSHWDFMGFTDEIDQEEFGPLWDVVSKIKHQLTNYDHASSFGFPMQDPQLPDEAWRRLGWYLAKNKNITSICAAGRRYITDKMLANMFGIFGSVIWTSSMIKLTFGGNSIGSEGIRIMTPFLRASGVRRLWMSGSPIGSEGFRLLINGLEGGNLAHLRLGDCGIEDVSCLDDCDIPNLTQLTLESNAIGNEGAMCVANNLLGSSSKLNRLCLKSCGIGDEGAQALSARLSTNTSLKHLDLLANKISIDGMKSFARALFNVRTQPRNRPSKTGPNHSLEELNLTRRWSITEKGHRILQFALAVNQEINCPRTKQDIKLAASKFCPSNCKDCREKGATTTELKCSLCLEPKLEFYVIVPCGHKHCSDCNSMFESTKCHSCCGNIEQRIKLH